MVYVRQEYLPNLKLYKYSGVDHSLTSKYILKPFYNNVVIKCFPMWMAPNLITLTGFVFIVANFLTLLWYNPNLDQDCPPWVYYSWAAGLFLYQTFDAVDGAQARRTRQSAFLTFYTQTWDEYHTKTLTLGIVNGPVEGVLILVCVYALTGYMGGASFWQQPMLATIGVPKSLGIPDYIYNLSFTEWYVVQGLIMLVFNTVESAQNVLRARRARGDRRRGALLGLVPFFGTWTLIVAYLWLQPIIRTQHLVPFGVFAGIVNAYSVGQMITAHLVGLPFPYWNVLVLPLAWGVIDSLGPVLKSHFGWASGWPSALGNGVYQVAFMFSMLGMAIGVYGSFVVDVIVTICDYLDIWCLTIKHPYVAETEEAGGKKIN
ncbi:hypothetical protein DL768_001726 [Monosporascus sp. mg162]|nr:hypothetical protein DL768_001726 [Monosporascus sp. mg162]